MSNRELTRSKFLEIATSECDDIKAKAKVSYLCKELQRQGYLTPEPEEPKKLTHIEAAAVIGRGGKVVSEGGYVEQPDSNGDIELYRSVIYTEIKKTIEIDTTVWVNVNSSGCYPYSSRKQADHFAGCTRIACVPVRIKETVEVE
ncbi:MAG: hypothetical protein CME63_01455 [Halobacteriovoraceae bacterium]|nr:hypothetical protein [Halobacteriovoraceae bacterium]|tara:strand:+ start:22366 stop:22800 length:435 start_codon:yes stop_codon:yes gene_type:complete